jgi:hypothetical protein
MKGARGYQGLGSLRPRATGLGHNGVDLIGVQARLVHLTIVGLGQLGDVIVIRIAGTVLGSLELLRRRGLCLRVDILDLGLRGVRGCEGVNG